jgi:hypothetical protein
VVRCGDATVHVSPAGLFRTVDAERPTLLLDEFDAYPRSSNYLRSLLDAAYDRESSVVIRKGGRYSVYTNICYALIGSLPDTLADRAIHFDMYRLPKDVEVVPFSAARGELERLRGEIAGWVEANLEALAANRFPKLPPELDSRARDVWRPLIATADCIGGEWPSRSRRAAVLIAARRGEDDEHLGTQQLRDLKELFEPEGGEPVKVMTSNAICSELCKLEDRPWHDLPLTPHKLAHALRPFHVKPRSDGTARRYHRSEFEPWFRRYCDD